MATTLDAKGNEIINGFSTNMTPTQNAISTSALSIPQNPLQVASVPDLSPIYSNYINSGTGQTQQATDLAQKQAEELAAQNQYTQGSNALSSLQAQISGKATDQATAYQTGGVNDLYKQLSGINVEAQGLARQAQAIPIQTGQAYQGTAGTQSGVESANRDLLQQNALKSLALGQRTAIAQGNYDVAKNLADQQISAKYAGIDAQIEAQKTNLATLDKIVLTPAQEKRKEAQAQLLKKQEQELADKKAAEKAVSDMLIEASPVAPPDVMARAKAVQAKGGSAMEVATALGKYGGDYLAREKIKAEIAKMDADAIKTRADAAKTRGETTGGGTGTTSTASDNAKAWLAQYNSGTMSLEDIYTKIGSSKEASLLKNEVARLIAAQGGKRVFGLDDASIQAINAQIKNVDDLLYGNGKKEIDKTTGDVGSIVGFVQGGLGVIPDSWNTGKQDALAVAKNLVSNQTLQALADAKAKGITFGALSEGELGLVADAASRISAKLKIDPKTKEIIGFTGSESQFKDDLKTIRDNLAKSIETKTQSKQSNMSKEESTADDIMTANKKIQSEINSGYNVFDN